MKSDLVATFALSAVLASLLLLPSLGAAQELTRRPIDSAAEKEVRVFVTTRLNRGYVALERGLRQQKIALAMSLWSTGQLGPPCCAR